MTTVYDVPHNLFIPKLASCLKNMQKFQSPSWTKFVKTGSHKERAPVQPEWWYTRVAAVMRKIYILGPIGVARLSAEFGGKKDRGSAPYHARRGSRAIVRHAIKQLQAVGFVTAFKQKGRIITPKGRAYMDKLAYELLVELSKTRPELSKYLPPKARSEKHDA